ncbi:phage tail protein [Actinokineospora sp. 24-640]
MRGIVPELPSPHPLIEFLPSVYAEDDLMVRLTAAFDDVLSASLASLDCLGAYVDPRLAPADFLDLLAEWLGVVVDDTWPESRRREAVVNAVELHRGRGTAHGLQWHLDLVTDGRARVVDDGGVRWSSSPHDDDMSPPPAVLVVRVSRELSDAEVTAVRDLVGWAKPAHLPHRVDVVDEL